MNILKFENVRSSQVHILPVKKALGEIYKGTYLNDIQTKKKVDLPLYVFQASYATARTKSAISEGSGIAVLDFDDVQDPAELKSLLSAEKWTMAAFRSTSGTGVKALIKIPVVHSDEEYKLFWMAIEMRYKNHHPVDISGKDISRACFVSYDPDIYVNLNCTEWNQQFIPPPPPPVQKYTGDGLEYDALQRAIERFKSATTDKHKALLATSRTIGGYVASGAIPKDDALSALEDAVHSRAHEYNQPVQHALKTMMAGFNYGMTEPLVPIGNNQSQSVQYGDPKNVVQSFDGWVLKPLSEYSIDYSEMKNPDDNPLTLGIPSFDAAMKNKYRGKLGIVIGYGGTKKSFFTKTVGELNALNNHIIIYSQMEMGLEAQIDRMMGSFTGEKDAIYKLEEMERVEKGSVKRFWDKTVKGSKLGENMLITDSRALQSADYHEMLEYAKEVYGGVDVLCIDGLSMMGGTGDEKDLYSRHTKELKELANLHNVLILLIAHCSRGATEHTRNIRKFVRGSEKILDNSDFDIAFSKIADPHDYQQEDIPYIQGMGYMRLWDKRGNGGVVNTLFDLDSVTLRVLENPTPTHQFEPVKKNDSFVGQQDLFGQKNKPR